MGVRKTKLALIFRATNTFLKVFQDGSLRTATAGSTPTNERLDSLTWIGCVILKDFKSFSGWEFEDGYRR